MHQPKVVCPSFADGSQTIHSQPEISPSNGLKLLDKATQHNGATDTKAGDSAPSGRLKSILTIDQATLSLPKDPRPPKGGRGPNVSRDLSAVFPLFPSFQ